MTAELTQDCAMLLCVLERIEPYLKYNKPVYTRSEMLELLGVDAKTLKRYMDEGLLGYSEPIPGGKIYFTHEDLTRFLAYTHKEAFAISGNTRRMRDFS